MTDPETRLSPDALLAQVQQDDAQAHRGKLKVFFGASPGVGKTYAMLMAARRLREQGVDVCIGIVETHGRADTARLLDGMDHLALREVRHDRRALREFDLTAALQRHPTVLLVDELAHSNVPGSRHPKRWQDVEELLAGGVDIYTTLNVQHLESVSDIVGGITGVRVRETLPDRVFEAADEVVLVDIPPDDLLQRLRDGKVYLPEQAAHAVRNFFRKGNLLALRQLALRLTAEQVEGEMRDYRSSRVGGQVWDAAEALLVCVGPREDASLVRAGARLADALHARWHVITVETPTLQNLHEARRDHAAKLLQLARELGAQTAMLAGPNAAEATLAYARTHNLNRVMLGRSPTWAWWRRVLGRSTTALLARHAPDLDLILITRAARAPRPTAARANFGLPQTGALWRRYLPALLISGAITLLASPLRSYFDLSNTVMLFMLGVVAVALRFGRGPAALAAIVNVLAFDFFYVPPRFSFAVSDVQYIFTFGVMLGVGLLIGHLTSHLHFQAKVAGQRERRTHDVYELSRELSGALTTDQVAEIGERVVQASFRCRASLLLLGLDDSLQPAAGTTPGTALPFDAELARWCLQRGEPAGQGTDTLPGAPLFYLPLKAPMRVRGVLVMDPGDTRLTTIPELRRLLETCATQIAIALERIHFVSVAQDTLLAMQAERMRNSLLSALSHDLRTPLTSLVGATEVLASRLAAAGTPQPATANAASLHAQALTIMRQARRLARMVDDLLDMARLQSGQVTLRHDWQSVEELVGSALRAVDPAQLAQHPLHVDLPADFPLVRADAVLLERVLVNLLDNALKFTPPGTPLGVRAQVQGAEALLTVWDQGPGLAHGRERAVFEKFTRGEAESSIPGMGLGLAICRVIVEAHGGTITAANQPQGGAAFSVRLPLQTAPPLEPGGDAEHQAETAQTPAAAATHPLELVPGPTAAAPTLPELP
ncbi:MAG: DUF4118 domain-containing protein [Betaproteobacteria bacterium]|nr:DUF4118 domain-containing protein [Betaproteobacteria bacterium]MDE2123076.1 DUF4118 domain-containing protein [Betaproteobacteria bacterium]MDE2186020.1 DUF4118 domain-containing protein [Betaproteobacteria bacterium]